MLHVQLEQLRMRLEDCAGELQLQKNEQLLVQGEDSVQRAMQHAQRFEMSRAEVGRRVTFGAQLLRTHGTSIGFGKLPLRNSIV